MSRRGGYGRGVITPDPLERLLAYFGADVVRLWDSTPSLCTDDEAIRPSYDVIPDQGPVGADMTLDTETVFISLINDRACAAFDAGLTSIGSIANIEGWTAERTLVCLAQNRILPAGVAEFEIMGSRNAAGTDNMRWGFGAAAGYAAEFCRTGANGTNGAGGLVVSPTLASTAAVPRLSMWGKTGSDPTTGYTNRTNGVERTVTASGSVGTTAVAASKVGVLQYDPAPLYTNYGSFALGFILLLNGARTAARDLEVEAYARGMWGWTP